MPTIKRGDEVMELTPLLREDDLPLQRLFRWEAEFATRIYLTQPLGNGESRDYSWAQTLDEARRMAAHLRSFGWPAGSCIAILSKNCAQWLIADFAIWIAGHVSVPIYPTLAATSIRQILDHRSEEHTSELQSLMRISYAVFCL